VSRSRHLSIYPEMLKGMESLEKRVAKYLVYPDTSPSRFVLHYHVRGPKLVDLTEGEIKALIRAEPAEIKKPKTEILRRALEKIKGSSLHEDLRLLITEDKEPAYLVGWTVVGLRLPEDLGLSENRPAKGYRAEEKCPSPNITGFLVKGEVVEDLEGVEPEDIEGVIVEGISDVCDEWRWDLVENSLKPRTLEAIYEQVALARQPVSWLDLPPGYIPPKGIGATIEGGGLFLIAAMGQVVFGALKPYFVEYFLKDDRIFKEWTRVVVRAVPVPRIDPETKLPIEGEFELLWRIMVAKTQKPYALERGMERGWYPPEGIIPFPEQWVKDKWPEDYQKWMEWVEEKWKENKRGSEALTEGAFTLHVNWWKGQEVIRRMKIKTYYLRLDDGKKRIRSFLLDDDPLWVDVTAAFYEGRVPRKWMTFEGKIPPGQRYNPLKRLHTTMEILDTGPAVISVREVEGAEIIEIDFRGRRLKGKYLLVQEEEDSPIYTLTPREVLALSSGRFKYDKHIILTDREKPHFDLRLLFEGFDHIVEFNLLEDVSKDPEKPTLGYKKKCYDLTWMEREGKQRVGALDTIVEVLDKGRVQLIESGPDFYSFLLEGRLLKGYWIAKRIDGRWAVSKSRIAEPVLLESEGHPEGRPFDPPRIEDHRGYFYLEIFDLRHFTYCSPEPRKYLDIEVPEGVIYYVCYYPRLGKIPGTAVPRVRFDKARWTPEEASKWLEKSGLAEYRGVQIRERT